MGNTKKSTTAAAYALALGILLAGCTPTAENAGGEAQSAPQTAAPAAEDAAQIAAADQLREAIAQYKEDNGAYPDSADSCGSACTLADLESVLVPAYLEHLPDAPGEILYAKSGVAEGYVLGLRRENEPTVHCRVLVDVSDSSGSFGVDTPECGG